MKRSCIVPAVALVLLALGCDDVTNGGNAMAAPGKYAGVWTCTYTQVGIIRPALIFDITVTHNGSQLSGTGQLQDGTGRNATLSGTVRPSADFSGGLIVAAFRFNPKETYDVRGKFTTDRTAIGTANGTGTTTANFTFTMTKK